MELLHRKRKPRSRCSGTSVVWYDTEVIYHLIRNGLLFVGVVIAILDRVLRAGGSDRVESADSKSHQ